MDFIGMMIANGYDTAGQKSLEKTAACPGRAIPIFFEFYQCGVCWKPATFRLNHFKSYEPDARN
jgi:hypothetical protein